MSADDGYPPSSEVPASGAYLEDLYRSYREPLVSFLRQRVPEESIAADITHTVFARLANGVAIRSIRDARQYLFRAARNQLADYYRASRTEESESAENYAADPTVHDVGEALCPEQEAIRRDKLDRLRAIIDAMPKKRRAVFLLARFREWTDTEIAAHMGMTPAAVRQHVSRAMRDCQVEMRRIFEETPAKGEDARRANGRAAQKR
jgi:RNA polymerase sigma-70 factor (ECF subfamily)